MHKITTLRIPSILFIIFYLLFFFISCISNQQLPETPTTYEKKLGTYYTVCKGDSLWKLARKFYNDSSKKDIIFEANRDKLATPETTLKPGWKLLIPTAPKKEEILERDQGLKGLSQEILKKAESSYELGEYDQAVVYLNTLLEKYGNLQIWEIKKGKLLLGQIAIVKKLLDGVQEKEKGKKALGKMEVSVDEVEGITWLRDKKVRVYEWDNMVCTIRKSSEFGSDIPYEGHNFQIYIGKKAQGTPWLRFEIGYTSEISGWLFINSYIIKADDKKFDLSAEGIKRVSAEGVSGVATTEKIDIYFTASIYEMIKAVIDSKKTILRYKGENSILDREITQEEKTALQNVLDAYEVLGGTFNFD